MSDGVFLDTAGILAVLNANDRWHLDAAPVFKLIRSSGWRPFTTNLVLAESANSAARLPIRSQVCGLAERLQEMQCIVVPDEGDWIAAWSAYRRGKAGDAGLVDHISFQVMRRLGLSRAFTNDRHFRAAGFETLY